MDDSDADRISAQGDDLPRKKILNMTLFIDFAPQENFTLMILPTHVLVLPNETIPVRVVDDVDMRTGMGIRDDGVLYEDLRNGKLSVRKKKEFSLIFVPSPNHT